MRIEEIRIQSFRGIEDATLILDPKLTVLVGANNAGKTTVLDALAAIVTYRRGVPAFLDTDFRATDTGADVRDSRPIVLTLRLVPSEGSKTLIDSTQLLHECAPPMSRIRAGGDRRRPVDRGGPRGIGKAEH